MAYGRGAFIPSPTRSENIITQAMVEQECVFPFQTEFANGNVATIFYNDNGSLISSSEYIKKFPNTFDKYFNVDFMSQVKISYDNGLTLYINRHPTNTWNVTPPSGTFYSYHSTQNLNNPISTNQYPGSVTLPNANGWFITSNSNLKTSSIAYENNELQYNLEQNYPNPFNSSTIIKYQIPTQDFVTLKLYDVTGRLISVLYSGERDAGLYTYSLKSNLLSSGVYFYEIKTKKGFNNVRKMLYVK